MKRLTTEKQPVNEMSMLELAHNGCYIDKNRNARYRDFSMDIDARDLVRKIYKDKNIAMPYEFWNDDDAFDEIMLANMEDGLEEVDGFIALFYRNLWAMAELREHLKVYEDLEEQGLLLKLPCKVGDTTYRINKGAENPIIEMLVTNIIISLTRGNRFRIDTKDNVDSNEHYYDISHIGKTVFLTKEEAEQALKEMEKQDAESI